MSAAGDVLSEHGVNMLTCVLPTRDRFGCSTLILFEIGIGDGCKFQGNTMDIDIMDRTCSWIRSRCSVHASIVTALTAPLINSSPLNCHYIGDPQAPPVPQSPLKRKIMKP